MATEESNFQFSAAPRGGAVGHWAHLLGALATFGLCLFSALDAGKIRPNDGTVWLLGRSTVTVLEVPPRADGGINLLQPGDEIIGIGTTLVASPQEAAQLLGRQQVGSLVPYLIMRDGKVLRVPVRLSAFRTADRFYPYYGFLSLAYWLIGLMIYLRGRESQAARLFFRMCLLFAVFFMTDLNRSSYFWGDIITRNAGALARFLLPALFLHFFLVFPDKKIVVTRRPWLEPLLYVLPLVFYLQFTMDQFFGSHAPRIYNTRWLVLGTFFSAGAVALLHSYYQFRDPLQRRRIRILTVGTLAGILPFLIFTVLPGDRVGDTLAFIGTVPMIAVPLSFSYCIARYRVMQIEVLLKRSLVYSLLTGGLFLLYLGCVLGLGALLLRLSSQTSQVATVAATLAAAASLWPARAHLQGQLDRRFFRSRGNLAGALQEFGLEIPQIIQQDALITRIGGRLCQLVDLPRLAVYRPDPAGESWQLAGVVGHPAASGPHDGTDGCESCPDELALAATSLRLAQFNEPYWIERSQTRLDVRTAATREQAELLLRLQERDELARLGLALLVPMLVRGRLVGLFALPPKHGGDDYQLQDLELLTLVAGQMALQIENSRLYEEELKKQKLEEQLTLARSIQSRLLPERLPAVGGLDLAACNLNSAEVSGDYYDLIERDDGQLVVIISDVSGKGIPASLLASSLQASLRAHCAISDSPGEILGRVNLYLYASTDPTHFATLFLAFVDPVRRQVRYSSGGHNAPIMRRADGSLIQLEKGGLPLGAFDFGSYEEETLDFNPGDMLFLYTDGLTETVDHADEEFGTARVERLLSEHHGLGADDLLAVMNAELRAFSGRDQADDDVTLLVLKALHVAAGNPADDAAYAQRGPAPLTRAEYES